MEEEQKLQNQVEESFLLREYIPSMGKCDILLIGRSVSGKSSFVNTIGSTPSEISRVAKIRDFVFSYPGEKIIPYRFNENVSLFELPRIVDNNDPRSRRFLNERKLPLDSNFASFLRNPDESKGCAGKFDVVVFVVDVGVKDNPNILENYRKYHEIARKQRIPVIFAVTKMDLFFEYKTKENILLERDVGESCSKLQKLTKELYEPLIQKKVGDERAVVLPFISYTKYDILANRVISNLTQEFVKTLTEGIERRYSKKEEEDEDEGEGEVTVEKPIPPSFRRIPQEPKRLVSHLSEYNPTMERCNILLIGLSGVGKSPLINTLSSTSKEIIKVAKVRKSEHGHCTTTYNQYRFNEKVSMCDTWGHSSLSESDFKSLLRGEVEFGYKKDKFGEEYDLEILSPTPDSKRKIDAVIFVVEETICILSHQIENMKKYIQVAKDHRIPFLFAVTKLDLYFNGLDRISSFSEDADGYFAESVLEETDGYYAATKIHQSKLWKYKLSSNIRNKMDEPEALVVPIINYHEAEVTNPVISFLACEFVKVMVEHIETHYRKKSMHESILGDRYGHHIMFEGETPIKLEYCRLDQEGEEKSIKEEEEEDKYCYQPFVFYDVFYTMLELGNVDWRFFVIFSKSNGGCVLAGLYNPDLDEYFECGGQENIRNDITRELLESSFERTYTQKYTLSLGTSSSVEVLDSTSFKKTGFVRITLNYNRSITLKRLRKDWSSSTFHVMMINYVQEKKSKDEMKKKMEEMEKKMEDMKNYMVSFSSFVREKFEKVKPVTESKYRIKQEF